MTRKMGGQVGVVAALLAAPSVYGQIQFTNVAGEALLNGDSFLSAHQHGLGLNWIDFNEDGWPDLFATNGFGRSAHLYWNLGGGVFANADFLLPAMPAVETMGSVFADYDNDGDSDIYVFTDHEELSLHSPSNPADGPPNLLLQNRWVENGFRLLPGQPLFVDVAAEAGVQDLAVWPMGPDYNGYRASSGAWLDYNRDGWVDLYVAHWVTGQNDHFGNQDRLYVNNGDGTFTDASAACGMHMPGGSIGVRPALVAMGAHLNQDLWPDVYVAHVGTPAPAHHDYLYTNLADSTFTDSMQSSPGCGDDSGAAMGIAVADIDLDSDWDVYLTDLWDPGNDAPSYGNPFYVNNGDGTFSDNSALQAGVVGHNSWGTNFLDVNHDGYEDLYVATMSGLPDFLYINTANGAFVDIGTLAGFNDLDDSRGSAVADFDRDGDQDIAVVADGNATIRLYRNDTISPGHWLEMQLHGVESNRDAIGTLVFVIANGQKFGRQITGGNSAHSQDSLVLHFGVGSATTVDLIQIFWPSGRIDSYPHVATDQRLTIVEQVDCPADVITNGMVDVMDFLVLLTAWGPSAPGPPDFDGDGLVDVTDMLTLLDAWGPC